MTRAPRASRLVVDATDLDRAAAFWAAFLDLAVLDRTAEWVDLSPLGEGGPVLSFQLVSAPKKHKNRLHLDVIVDPAAGGAAAAAHRAKALGATPVTGLTTTGTVSWQVWRDREGNEFCLCSESDDVPAPAAH